MRRALLLLFVAAGCGTSSTLDLLPGDGGSSEGAADACVQNGCPCGLTLCNGACVDLLQDPLHCGTCPTTCQHNAYCASGSCQCLPRYTACGQGCSYAPSDPDHCGGCGVAPCKPGEKCESGVCGTGACTGGRTACDVTGRTACVDLASGIPYCGACGVVCAPDEVCAAGKCARYAPATPCTTCPCASQCTKVVGSTTCCAGIAGGSTPICVASTQCP